MAHTHKPRIGITLGDLNGVGPEVVIKALADHRMVDVVTSKEDVRDPEERHLG